jgi:hypothetical protein
MGEVPTSPICMDAYTRVPILSFSLPFNPNLVWDRGEHSTLIATLQFLTCDDVQFTDQPETSGSIGQRAQFIALLLTSYRPYLKQQPAPVWAAWLHILSGHGGALRRRRYPVYHAQCDSAR